MSESNSNDLEFESFVFQNTDSLKKSSTKASIADDRDLAFLLSVRGAIFSPYLKLFAGLLEESRHFRPKVREMDEDQIQDFRDEGFRIAEVPIRDKTRLEMAVTSGCLNVFRAVYNNPEDQNIRDDAFGRVVLEMLERGFGKETSCLRDAGEVLAEAFYEEQNDLCRFVAKESPKFQLNGYPQMLSADASGSRVQVIYKSTADTLDANDQEVLGSLSKERGYQFRETKLGDAIGPFKILYRRPEDKSWVVQLAQDKSRLRNLFKRWSPDTVTILTDKHLAGRNFHALTDLNVSGFTTGVPKKNTIEQANEQAAAYRQFDDIIQQAEASRISVSSLGQEGVVPREQGRADKFLMNAGEGEPQSPRSTLRDSISDTSTSSVSSDSARSSIDDSGSEWSVTTPRSQDSSPMSSEEEANMQRIADAYQKRFPNRFIPSQGAEDLLTKFVEEKNRCVSRGELPPNFEKFIGDAFDKLEQLRKAAGHSLPSPTTTKAPLAPDQDREPRVPESPTGRKRGR
jgi:hypothetical protein